MVFFIVRIKYYMYIMITYFFERIIHIIAFFFSFCYYVMIKNNVLYIYIYILKIQLLYNNTFYFIGSFSLETRINFYFIYICIS